MMTPYLEECLAWKKLCRRPIFVIGSPRSGTSILAWSLAQHSRLWTSAESDILHYLFGSYRARSAYEASVARPDGTWLAREKVSQPEFLAFLGLGLNALFSSRAGGRRWIDQTPLYTLMVDDLAELFPEAQFVHILRDGRSVVRSMTHFAGALGEKLTGDMSSAGRLPPWATDFSDACQTWSRFVEASLDFQRRHPSRCLTVRNDALVANPLRTFAELLGFLGEAPETGPSEYFQTHRINSSFPADRPASQQPSAASSSWTSGQQQIFASQAGETMVRCGLATRDELQPAKTSDNQAEWCAAVCAMTPAAAQIAVVSKGDERLINFPDRRGWHFPRTREGCYAGAHPADSGEATTHLEDLRRQGAQFLAFPPTSRWWLDYYDGFRQHLDGLYTRVAETPQIGVLFHVQEARCERDEPRTAHERGCSANRALTASGSTDRT